MDPVPPRSPAGSTQAIVAELALIADEMMVFPELSARTDAAVTHLPDDVSLADDRGRALRESLLRATARKSEPSDCIARRLRHVADLFDGAANA